MMVGVETSESITDSEPRIKGPNCPQLVTSCLLVISNRTTGDSRHGSVGIGEIEGE